MKYIAFGEFCPEDLDKLIEKEMNIIEERKKFPEKYPKPLFPSYSMGGELKFFGVYEATPEQLTNHILYWTPLMKIKYVPILETAKIVEQYLKSKK